MCFHFCILGSFHTVCTQKCNGWMRLRSMPSTIEFIESSKQFHGIKYFSYIEEEIGEQRNLKKSLITQMVNRRDEL